MNLWHDVPRGSRDEFNVIVEIPRGSHNKYEIDKETGLIALDRVNYGAAAYPFNYCYIPQTLWEDGDALDVMLLATNPIHPGIMVACRPVAVMRMDDCGENDDKIIAVPVEDKRFDHMKSVEDIAPHLLKEFANFFETLKNLKGNSPEDYQVKVTGFEGAEEAKGAFDTSVKLYDEKFSA